ncbi:22371_t:CDS:2, partial [Gigaspora margarita]
SPKVPFNLPIIGHTINYLFNAEKFLIEYRKKEPFNIYIFWKCVTYVENKTSSKVFKELDIFEHEQVLLEEDLMEYFLNDSDYVPNDVNDDYIEFLFEQLIVALFVEFLRQSKLLRKSSMVICYFNGESHFIFAIKLQHAVKPELLKDIYEEQLDDLLKETLRHSFLGKYFLFDKDSKQLCSSCSATDSHFYSQVYKNLKDIIYFKNVKHACPGRIFAATEIKLCLYELILKNNIRTESGKVGTKLKSL